ncbi:mRNA splicing factor [Heliocybe sulcata]|uniref:mRNA splicing factor n=1 Tax=Heliocybe sulcata TaxID=5364 RepID=A0A5C3NDZ4_9AGAM|nr:mRNA splicing factor [Heliocybe sulcata]
MSLAEASESRKARLVALRKRRAGEDVDEENFDPETRTLKKRTQDDELGDTVEKAVEGLADQIIAEDEERRGQDLDLFNIAPKRPNWDLKREMEKKMAKLERQTQRAIHTLIRQRLAAQKGQSDDLVGAMRAQEDVDMQEPNSDEE